MVNLRVPKGTEDEIPEPKDVKPTDALPYEDAHVAKTPVSYVAFQFKGDDFNKYRRFILGNEKTRNRERRQVVDYYNGPLHPDTQYRAFTRAFTSQVPVNYPTKYMSIFFYGKTSFSILLKVENTISECQLHSFRNE